MTPAERFYAELRREEASIWYISDEYGSKIIIKVPSTTARAIIKGCKVHMLFGKDTRPNLTFFHTGVRVFDDPINTLAITGIHRFIEEHRALVNIMSMQKVHIELFNELCVCIAYSQVTFKDEDRRKILLLLDDAETLYCGDYGITAVHSSDCFDYSLDKTREFENPHEIETLIIEVEFEQWKSVTNHFIGLNEDYEVIIDHSNEGDTFEKQAWVSLEGLFNHDIHRNPLVRDKQKYRELIDVLTFHQYGIFLIETKALAVLEVKQERNMERKVKGLQKQILKAINQVTGAAKKLAANEDVTDSKGNPLAFDKTIKPHCVVLVSELLPFGNWEAIETKIFETMIRQPMFLNVMDLREFTQLIRFSKTKEYLDFFLMERVKLLMKHKTIHLRMNIKPQ